MTLLVAVSTGASLSPPQLRLNAAYPRALMEAGITPLVVPPLLDELAAAAILRTVHGLVLTGGEDVDPAAYRQPAHPTVTRTDPARDRTELALARAAHAARVPTLCICRGLQLMNVALGGTLVQDIASARPGAAAHARDRERTRRVHPVAVTPGSRLAVALGTTALAVNSMHHQALDRVADALEVTARAPDGVVEGAEARDAGWWMVGAQWHPEELVADPLPADRLLFAAFAAAARAHRPG